MNEVWGDVHVGRYADGRRMTASDLLEELAQMRQDRDQWKGATELAAGTADVFRTERDALQALVDEVAEYHECGCPDTVDGYPVPANQVCSTCRAQVLSPKWQAAENARMDAQIAAWEAEEAAEAVTP